MTCLLTRKVEDKAVSFEDRWLSRGMGSFERKVNNVILKKIQHKRVEVKGPTATRGCRARCAWLDITSELARRALVASAVEYKRISDGGEFEGRRG